MTVIAFDRSPFSRGDETKIRAAAEAMRARGEVESWGRVTAPEIDLFVLYRRAGRNQDVLLTIARERSGRYHCADRRGLVLAEGRVVEDVLRLWM